MLIVFSWSFFFRGYFSLSPPPTFCAFFSMSHTRNTRFLKGCYQSTHLQNACLVIMSLTAIGSLNNASLNQFLIGMQANKFTIVAGKPDPRKIPLFDWHLPQDRSFVWQWGGGDKKEKKPNKERSGRKRPCTPPLLARECKHYRFWWKIFFWF